MSPYAVDVQVEEPFAERVESELLRRVALATLIHQEPRTGAGPCELTVVISDDETLRELNRRFRGQDEPTDVLAFPDDTRGPFASLPGMPRYLGDVVISYPRAEAQATEAGHTPRAELQLLVVHGVLHLLGHDDSDPQARATMWQAQSAILRALGVEVHLPD